MCEFNFYFHFQILNLLAWTGALATLGILIYLANMLAEFDSKFQPIHYGLYDGLSRVCWSIALSYVIFACAHNAGGRVNRFLSLPLWQPLSRLSYSMYIVSFPVIVAMAATTKTSSYFSQSSFLIGVCFSYVFIVLLSAIAAIMFEIPFVTIEKFVSDSRTKVEHLNGSGNEATRMNALNGMIQQNALKKKYI